VINFVDVVQDGECVIEGALVLWMAEVIKLLPDVDSGVVVSDREGTVPVEPGPVVCEGRALLLVTRRLMGDDDKLKVVLEVCR